MDTIKNYTDVMRLTLYYAMFLTRPLQVVFGEFPDNLVSGNNFPTIAGLDAGNYTATVYRLAEEDVIFYINQADNDTSAYVILPISRIRQLSGIDGDGPASFQPEAICEPGSFAQRLIAYSIQMQTTLDSVVGNPQPPLDNTAYYSSLDGNANWAVTNYRGAYFQPFYTSDFSNWSPPL